MSADHEPRKRDYSVVGHTVESKDPDNDLLTYRMDFEEDTFFGTLQIHDERTSLLFPTTKHFPSLTQIELQQFISAFSPNFPEGQSPHVKALVHVGGLDDTNVRSLFSQALTRDNDWMENDDSAEIPFDFQDQEQLEQFNQLINPAHSVLFCSYELHLPSSNETEVTRVQLLPEAPEHPPLMIIGLPQGYLFNPEVADLIKGVHYETEKASTLDVSSLSQNLNHLATLE